MPYQSFRILDVEWADLKTFKTRDTFTLYYVAGPSNASYEVIGNSDLFVYRSKLTLSADVSDFTTNFLSGAIAADSIDDAIGQANKTPRTTITGSSGLVTTTTITPGIGLDVNIIGASFNTIDTGSIVWTEQRVTTSNQNLATVVSYTIPTGKQFYLMQFSLDRVTVNNTNCEGSVTIAPFGGGSPVEFAATGFNGANSAAWTVFMTVALCRIAGPGDVVALKITPSSSTTTIWAGRIIGALK